MADWAEQRRYFINPRASAQSATFAFCLGLVFELLVAAAQVDSFHEVFLGYEEEDQDWN